MKNSLFVSAKGAEPLLNIMGPIAKREPVFKDGVKVGEIVTLADGTVVNVHYPEEATNKHKG